MKAACCLHMFEISESTLQCYLKDMFNKLTPKFWPEPKPKGRRGDGACTCDALSMSE